MNFLRYLRLGNFWYYNGVFAMLVIVLLIIFYVLKLDAIFWIAIYLYASLLFATLIGNLFRWLHYKQYNRAYKFYNDKTRYN